MCVETEAGRALHGLVAAGPLENAAPVVNDVRGHVDIGVFPVHERAVHPDFAGSRESHCELLLSIVGEELASYCFSWQNGHLSDRACSGLRQCQQKRAGGVSRALSRD